jgi:hypothetical protein
VNRQNRTRFLPCLEALESRELKTVGLSSLVSTTLASHTVVATTAPAATFTTFTPIDLASSLSDQSLIKYLDPKYQLPQLSSLPGSAHTLYLNFGGDSRADWFNIDYGTTNENHYKNVKMSAFDTDGDPSTYSDTEKAQITEIWARVAEAYAPFDVNVTTIDPASHAHGKTLIVDIGKSNGWLGTSNTGISSIGSFTSTAPNVVFDFCDQIGSFVGGPSGPLDTAKSPNFVMQVANTATHESGHGFGLFHDRLYNADHTVSNEYDPGNANWTPFMGNNLTAARHTWTLGITGWNDNTPTLQWDAGTLDSALGYRSDDFGDDTAHATPLTFGLLGTATVKGVVGYHPPSFLFEQPDVDVFSFNTQAGSVTVEADVLGYKNGAILDARIELWSAQGTVAATTAPLGSNARLTANLAGGTYYVKVMSGGGLTDVGQYTLTVNRPSEYSVAQVVSTKAFTTKGLIGGLTADALAASATLAVDAATFVPRETATAPTVTGLASTDPSDTEAPPLPANLDAVAELPADSTLVATMPDTSQVASTENVDVAVIAPAATDLPTVDSAPPDSVKAPPTAAVDALLAVDTTGVLDVNSTPSTATLDALFAGTDPSVLALVYPV